MGNDDHFTQQTYILGVDKYNPRSGQIFPELFTQLYHLPLDSEVFYWQYKIKFMDLQG